MKLRVAGLNGLGDSMHQRAPIRRLLAAGYEIWLETPIPCVYHDLAGPNLHFLDSKTRLRTQAKNIARERGKFTSGSAETYYLSVSYNGKTVQTHGSVLAAICRSFGVDPAGADFRLPVPADWIAAARKKVPCGAKPLMIYRPAVVRSEWGGAATRNPDQVAYSAIFRAIRDGFQVVSVADVESCLESIVGVGEEADVTLHRGELNFEELAGLVKSASLIYTTAGMGTVLAQAVGTPCITVFGGYESAASYMGGAGFADWLPIELVTPCVCWSHDHDCDKRIDVGAAIERARQFAAREMKSRNKCVFSVAS